MNWWETAWYKEWESLSKREPVLINTFNYIDICPPSGTPNNGYEIKPN